MDNIVICGVSCLEFLLRVSFMWLAVLCIINFYARHDMNWFFMGCFYVLLALNRVWYYNIKLGEWILDNKAHWLEGIDRVAPWLMVYEEVSTWIMFLFYCLMFIGFITLISQMFYKKLAFMMASMGLVAYMVAFVWWIFWVLTAATVIPCGTIFGDRIALVIFGNILFTIAFILAMKRAKLKDYIDAKADN